MANKNKVEFGTKLFHIGTYTTDEAGAAVLGDPMHVPGMRALTLEAESEETKFFADDVVYYSQNNDNGLTGELGMALFPDEFKTTFLNYANTSDGGVAQVKSKPSKQVYIIFQGSGDKHNRRHILFNVSLGAITREHKTIEESVEVEEETLPITVTGDNKSGIMKITYSEGDEGYETLLTAPVIPTLAETIPEA